MIKLYISLIIFAVLFGIRGYASDIKVANSDGYELCYNFISDTTVELTSEANTTVWDENTSNYAYIESDTLRIPGKIFYGSKQYKVISIGVNALTSIKKVKFLYIPKTLEKISSGLALYSDICEFIVDVENPYFTCEEGVLYDKDKKTLLNYPPAKLNQDYYVKDGVEHINDMAFWTDNIKSLTASLSVKSIGIATFNGSSFEQIIFKDSLVSVGALAFGLCPNLKLIVFGTELKDVYFANIAYYRPIVVECRANIPPRCILYDNQPSYLGQSTLKVPRKSLSLYQQAEGWNKFNILPIEPPIVAGADETTVSWVQNFSATGYVWTLYSDEQQTNMVMELTFNERGYLTDIVIGNLTPGNVREANAPSRMPAEGDERRFAEYYSFTIRSLTPNTTYYYTRQALAGDEVIDEEQGSFTTLPDTGTGREQHPSMEVPAASNKLIRDGQLQIRCQDKTYSVQGVETK